jgi:hypothetical protein
MANSVLKFTFSPDDRALIAATADGSTDLPPSRGGVRIGLAQNTSAAINKHEPGYIAGLSAGDFWLPVPGSDPIVFKSGFACVLIAFERKFVRWGLEIGGPPLDILDEAPAESSRGVWFAPVVTLLGRVGDPLGPDPAEWRAASKSRLAYKQNMPWETPDTIPAIAPPEPQMSRRRKAAALPGDDDPDAAARDQIPF